MIKKIIKSIKYFFKSKEEKMWLRMTPDERLNYIRKKGCEYTIDEGGIRTDMRNMMQHIKIKDAPTGWGIKMLKQDEIKNNLDSGICWVDYPVLNEDGTIIKGMTGLNFG